MAQTLHHLMLRAAQTDPEHEAVRCAGRSLSYAGLERDSRRLAVQLRRAGLREGDRVAIHLPKAVEMLIALYGALRAGCAYVPIDPHAPLARATAVANDCGVRALITTPGRAASLVPALETPPAFVALVNDPAELPASGGTIDVPWEFLTSLPDAGDDALLDVEVNDGDLAYILYTSGSTGTPKGVTLTHGNALCFVEWSVERMGVTAEDRLSNHAPLHFDLSVFDLFVAAAAGAAVVLVPDELSFFGSELSRFIRDEAITTWYSVPSALTMIARSGVAADLVSLRSVVFAGEVFPTARLRALRAVVPQAELWNLYGPTETNVCTYHRVGDLPDDDRPIPIGRACEYDDVFAIREDGGIAGVGELGELYVGGRSVMRGYWGREEATVDALVPDPLGRSDPDRVYRTGDLVRLRPDGEYDFHGRRDHQIKSRGFRIELAEVETALARHPSVEAAAAIAVPHEDWGSMILAFVSVTDRGASERELRRHVGSLLPRYMMPTEIVIIDALPRTSTGKVGRGRLVDLRQPAPDGETRTG